jgi:hypothetical protein
MIAGALASTFFVICAVLVLVLFRIAAGLEWLSPATSSSRRWSAEARREVQERVSNFLHFLRLSRHLQLTRDNLGNVFGSLIWLLLVVATDMTSPLRRLVMGAVLLWLLHRCGMLAIVSLMAALRMMTEAPLLPGAPNFGAAFVANAFLAVVAAAAVFAIAKKPANRSDVRVFEARFLPPPTFNR